MTELDAPAQVVRVSTAGVPIGTTDLAVAHQPPGVLHLAVSVMLVSQAGWIVQRRARTKRLFAGLWANSCCTHPCPDEAVSEAAQRRVRQELGVGVNRLVHCGTFTYRAYDAVADLLESEFDHVFVGSVTDELVPDPAEIDDIAFVTLEHAATMLAGSRGAPWALTVLQLAATRAAKFCV